MALISSQINTRRERASQVITSLSLDIDTSTLPIPSKELLTETAPFQSVYGCEHIKAIQAISVFQLWQRWEKEIGRVCDVPFWATVWPGASVLARYIHNNSHLVKDATILEIGCGGAVASISALLSGASKAIANDIDPIALYIAQENAQYNGVELTLSQEDMSKSKGHEKYDLILVGDFFYQRETAERMLKFLRSCSEQGSMVLIADGHRPFAPKNNVEVLETTWVPVDLELEGIKEREVRLLHLLK